VKVRVFRECSRFDLVFHAVAGALDDDRLGMVEEPVEHRGGDGAVVVENGGPLLEEGVAKVSVKV
jgi:hypothetical protein